METIYKSCTAGLSDEAFANSLGGLVTFISFERLLRESIKENLRPTERIRGMVIDSDGITLYLENMKKP